MKNVHLPYVKLPAELLVLLKSNLTVVSTPGPVFDIIRPNAALYHVLQVALNEFDDGRGVEKLLLALGWSNFRERLTSLYIFKSIFSEFPTKTDMALVEDIKLLEKNFLQHGVHGYSRLFLLGLYVRLANIQTQSRIEGQFPEIKIPLELISILKLSQGRSEKIDWLLLILVHLSHSIGEDVLKSALASGLKFKDLYSMMSVGSRESMFKNLLAYGASINEPDFFLYEKV